MDWLKLFALLVAAASVQITAEGPKKKIRIHLPQKVKHIHHHKKIYITNHPAPSQYAPAYLPGVKGALALPSNAARPAVASIVPINSMELYDEARSRLPAVNQAASKLLPLYRARGHYGPHHAQWEEPDFEMATSPEQNDVYSPPTYKLPPPAPISVQVKPTKKIKIVKLNDTARKKVLRKVKPKRVYVRPKHPLVQQQVSVEDEHPVSSFHEQFYSDLAEAGTIRKIKKPPRIEKIIDGDTEHIHTYSEEHIHKVVFDDDSKVTGVVGVDPVGSMTALNAAHPLVPLKNAQSLVAYPTNSVSDLSVMGSLGTPSHLEYAAYNPRDVTHDHIFHDHGEIPRGVDITKEGLRLPPKVSYNHHGLRVSSSSPLKRYYGKRYSKPTKPTHDFSYYEGFYGPTHTPNKVWKPTPATQYEIPAEPTITDFRPVPQIRFKEKRKQKHHNYGYGKSQPNFPNQQASVPAPFSVSSTVVHDYDHKGYAASGPSPSGFSKYTKEQLSDFRDSYNSDADYDAYASSSNIHTSEDKTDEMSHHGKNGKKSISTQNISFGGQDSQSFVDHFAASASDNSEVAISQISPTALEQLQSQHEADVATPTPYTIKETSPAHPYYTAMAFKALQGDDSEIGNENEVYDQQPSKATATESAEASAESPTENASQTVHVYKIQSTDAIPEPDYMVEIPETRPSRKRKERNRNENKQRYNAVFKDLVSGYSEGESDKHEDRQHDRRSYYRSSDSSSVRGSPQYGDKI